MKKQKKTVTYYAVRETCPQPYYDVQMNYNKAEDFVFFTGRFL